MTLDETARRGSAHGRCVLFFLAVAAFVLTSVDARAQVPAVPAVTGIVGRVLRVEPDGITNADNNKTGDPHPGGVPENVINYADCEANLSFEVTVSLSGTYPGYDLVAWAGPADCTPVKARSSGTAVCWPVTAGPIVQGSATTDGGAPTATILLRMQDIASQAGVAPGTPITPVYPQGGAGRKACSAQTSTPATPIWLRFFFTDRIGVVANPIGYQQAYPVVVDTVAEDVRNLGKVGSTGFSVDENLNSQLTVSVGATSDSDTVGFNVYCDPLPGKETAVNRYPYDAPSNGGDCSAAVSSDGASDDASDSAAESASSSEAGDATADALAPTDDGAATDSASPQGTTDEAGGSGCGIPQGDGGGPSNGCSAGSPLQSAGGTRSDAGFSGGGQTPPKAVAPYWCGQVSAANPTLTLTGLLDGDYYGIAVAAVDGAGNVGPLSLQCKNLLELQDFWYKYTLAGGQAGGGYCSAAEGVGVPAGTSGLGLLMIASIVALVRKRRRGAPLR